MQQAADAYIEAQRKALGQRYGLGSSTPARIAHRIDDTDERDGFRLVKYGVKIQLIETNIKPVENLPSGLNVNRVRISWRMYMPNLFTAAALMCPAVRWASVNDRTRERYSQAYAPPIIGDMTHRLDGRTGEFEVWLHLLGNPADLAVRRALMHTGEFWIPSEEKPTYTRWHVELINRCDEAMKEARRRLAAIKNGKVI